MEIVNHFQSMGFKKFFIYKNIKIFEKQKKSEKKTWFVTKMCHDSKVHAKLKKQKARRTTKFYRKCGQNV
jgi:hypothetical protein